MKVCKNLKETMSYYRAVELRVGNGEVYVFDHENFCGHYRQCYRNNCEDGRCDNMAPDFRNRDPLDERDFGKYKLDFA